MSMLLHDIPDAYGQKVTVENGAVMWTQAPPDEICFKAKATMVMIFFTVQPKREVALNGGRRQIFTAPVGGIEIVPEGSDMLERWVTHKENLLCALYEYKLSLLSGAEFENEHFTLRPPKLGSADHKALVLANLFRDEFMGKKSTQKVYLDTLTTLLGIHILRTYSSLKDQMRIPARGGLSTLARRILTEYIDENLSEDLSVAVMSNIVGLSPSYFLRAFRQTFGQAPHQYILSQRVARAVNLIRETAIPIGDIARTSGFSNNSHMTSVMRRLLGTVPRDLRRDI